MKTFISLLRGINVSGQNQIRMAELKALYERLGFGSVQTYLQSGNVVFTSEETNIDRVIARIEEGIGETFGCSVAVMLLETRDLQRIVAGNPFLHGRSEDTSKLHVTFLAQMPTPIELEGIFVPQGETAEFEPGAQEIYIFAPDGYGRTKLSNQFFERKLHMTATTRNWNTVNALFELAQKTQA